MGSQTLTPLSEQDRTAVIDIFNHYVEHSFAAYPEKKLDYSFYDNFLALSARYPSAVMKLDGAVIGFGMLRPYSPMPVFARAAEITYFLDPSHTGRGAGATLLDHLCREGKNAGIDTIIAGISSKNEPSLRFHAKHGFADAGRLVRAGRKHGEDFDVVLMQKFI